MTETPFNIASNKKKEELPEWSMYPELHDNITEELKEDQLKYTFFKNGKDLNSTYTYDTNIKGSSMYSCKRLCLSGYASIPRRFTSDRLLEKRISNAVWRDAESPSRLNGPAIRMN